MSFCLVPKSVTLNDRGRRMAIILLHLVQKDGTKNFRPSLSMTSTSRSAATERQYVIVISRSADRSSKNAEKKPTHSSRGSG